MALKPLDDRQVVNRAALAAIGSAANSSLDIVFSDINTLFANATSAPTPSVLMKRDANANTQVNNLIENETVTITAAGSTALTVTSAYFQQFIGVATQTVVLPNATTLLLGQSYYIANRSLATIVVNDNSSALVQTMASGTQAIFRITNISTSAGLWDVSYTGIPNITSPGTVSRNFLINSAFDYWQRGTSAVVANGSTVYQADRWYAQNGMGTGGVLTMAQVAATLPGSLWAAKVTSSTAPSSPGTSGINLVQVIDNQTTQQIYDQAVSFQIQVKAVGNVSQVTVALVYATSEIKPTLTNVLGAVAVTVNSSTFSICSLPNINVGTTPTSSGVVAAVVYVSGVSSGNVTDLGNGFIVEQAMVNSGISIAAYSRAGENAQSEFAMCQRYFEAGPGTLNGYTVAANAVQMQVSFNVFKRVNASMTLTTSSSGNLTAVNGVGSQQGWMLETVYAIQGPGNWIGTWTAEADI